MKDKQGIKIQILTILGSICISIGCGILNFQEFLMGNPANVKHIVVTFLYIISWIIFIVMGVKLKSRMVLRYCLIFWLITLFAAGAAMYNNITGITFSLGLLLVALFLGQFYGIDYFVTSYLDGSIIIVSISLIMSGLALSAMVMLAFRRIK